MGKRGPKPKNEMATNEIKEDTVKSASLTPDEMAIFQRVQAEKDDWQTITEADVHDFSLAQYPFQLPPEAQKLLDEKQFAFRYAEMKPAKIDMLRNAQVPLKWWIANKTTLPQLSKYCDPIHGAIQELDQILMFKPYWMHRKVLDAKRELAEIQDKGGSIELKDGNVDPDKGVEWHSGEKHKITSRDEVMDPGGTLNQAYESEAQGESSSDLGDLVVE